MSNPISRMLASFKRVDDTRTPVPYYTMSGDSRMQRASVSKSGALMSNAYLTAEQAKLRAFGALPGRVYRDGENGREPVKDHPLSRLISRRWNPIMTAQTGWQWLFLRRDTYGTAYIRVEWKAGRPVAFWPLECDVRTEYDPDAEISPVRYVVSGDKFTPKGTYLQQDIWAFLTCISTDGGVTGRSLAELAAAEIGLSIDLTRFYANIIGKGFNPAGVIETDEDLDLADVEALAAKNKAMSGPEHAGELRIFDKGLKYKSIGQTMAEANIVEQQTFILQSVARSVYVQPNKVMDYSRATFSNIEEANISFVTDTMLGETTAIEAVLNGILEEMRDGEMYVKFDLRGLQRGDFKSQMEGYRIGVYAGIYKRSEIREWQELPYVEGSDELLQPSAYYTIDPETGDPRPLPSAPTRQPADAYLAPVLDDARDRVSLRASKDGDTAKTREFARKAFSPVAQAFAACGIEFDIEREIEEAVNG